MFPIKKTGILTFLLFVSVSCSVFESGADFVNQGNLIQLENGNLRIEMNAKGIRNHPDFNEQTVVMAYVFNFKADFKQPCAASPDNFHCIDSLGFANEPGFFGYNRSTGKYNPLLMNGTVNPHPITNLNTDLNRWVFHVYAADSHGYLTTYFYDYNDFQSLNHVVAEGQRYDVYFALHFNAINKATDEADRFKSSSSVFRRPIAPNLISPKTTMRIKLSPDKNGDVAGNIYEIPDFSSWTDPYSACKGASLTPVDSEKQVALNQLRISEVNWMGSRTSDASVANTSDEFLEIINTGNEDIYISDWVIEIQKTDGSGFSVAMPKCLTIGGNATTNKITIGSSITKAFTSHTVTHSSVSLLNSGNRIRIKDAKENLVFELNCLSGWPAGNKNSPIQSMRLKSSYIGVPTCTTAAYENTPVSTPSSEMSNLRAEYQYLISTQEGTLATPGY